MKTMINKIVDECALLRANERYDIEKFGNNGDLTLHIFKDEDYDPFYDIDAYNMVDIVAVRGDQTVCDSVGIHIMDLYEELKRIGSYQNLSTL